jgi:hypothetical protein
MLGLVEAPDYVAALAAAFEAFDIPETGTAIDGTERGTCAVCHEYRHEYWRCATVREMKEGPSGSAIRSRSQATASRWGQKPWW